jgi:alpha-mannosidase
VHDDRSLVEARLERVVRERIVPALVAARSPLTVSAWEVPGEPVPVTDALIATYEPFPVGAPWGRPWGTTWFRMVGTVPADWAGRRVEAQIKLGFTNSPGFQAEGLLWRPDPESSVDPAPWVPWRGLHPLNHDVAVADPAVGGEAVSFLVEAAANPTLTAHRPDRNSDLITAGSDPIYALSRAELVLIEVDVVELREDVRSLTELMGQLPLDQPRRHEILRALERMLDVLVLDDLVATAAGARAELAEVLSRPAVPSAHRLSAIGHAHIDSAWLWPIRETKRKCARTFSNVLALMEDEPDLRFACSQAAQYEWMLDGYPSVFEGIRKRVADGRWIPVGGMWVEPDTNLAGGEALVRQITHGQRFFEEHFGRRSTEVWIPDVFGYPASLPQIMRLGGISRFLTQKMSWNKTNKFPHHTFWWEGIDGSEVFTHFPPIDSYNALFSPMQLTHAVRNFTEKGRATRSLVPFGFGNGGGGPNRQMMRQFRRVRDLEGLPRVEIESAEEFFDAAMAEYPDAPRWVGELYFETHRGTFTSQAGTKAGNRRSELLLREAELWCVAAYGTTEAGGYPMAELDRIWKTVLLHQFHDILPGSSIGWVHREAEATYAGLADQLEAIIAGALDALTGSLGTVGSVDGVGAMLTNAAPHDRDEVVVLPAAALGGLPATAGGVQVLSDGESVAARVQVPALGLAPLVPVVADDAVTWDAARRILANDLVAVTFDADGLFSSVCDLTAGNGAGREVLVAGERGNLLQLHPDLPSEYDAWDLDDHYRRQAVDLTDLDRFEVLDRGPLVGRVRISRTFRSSTVTQVVALRAGSPRIDIATEIDWYERDHVLKAAFPLDVHADHLTREIQFGHVATAIHTNTSWDAARFEVCAHRWVEVAEPGYGVALLNDAKYGHDATRTRSDAGTTSTTLRLTLLKGAQYPDPHADEGHHAFTYALLPHAGDHRTAGIVAEGYRLNLPVRAISPRAGHVNSGPNRVTTSPLVVTSADPAVVVEAVKPADDGSGDLVVRCYESFGGRADLDLRLAFEPAAVMVTDLLEEPSPSIPPVAIEVAGARVSGTLRPFQVVTLRIAGAGGER